MRWPPPADWPHARHSRQVLCRPHRWHVQEMGEGPTLLLLHGAGGSTHSFRGLMPILAQGHHVVALDLPGHGFTRLGARHRSGLRFMAEDIAALARAQDWRPAALIGHSAGGAIALRVAETLGTPKVIGINPALSPFEGVAGVLFPAMARMLALTPFAASTLAAASMSPARVRTLIENTGSRIDAQSLDCYARLAADRDHVDGTLLMMAAWGLRRLLEDLPTLDLSALFLTGARDSAVPPRVAQDAAGRMRSARCETLEDLGHLAHEEDPARVADRILACLGDSPPDMKKAAPDARPLP